MINKLRKYLSLLFLIFINNFILPQATAFFTCPDTVCVNQSFTINNQCVSANSYYWSFCQGNNSLTPVAANLGNIGLFSGPVFNTIAKDGSNYYVFVDNNLNGTLSRLSFGSSLLNTPTAVNLGNVSGAFPGNIEDIWLQFEGGNWYGILVGGVFPSNIVRLSFGNSLANTPTAVNLGNIGGLSYPTQIKIFNSGGNYYGFITNANNNSITRLNFGSSITNTPTGTNLGNIGTLNTPVSIGIINYAGLWHAYINNETTNSVTRLDFGNNLLNVPTGINLGNTGSLNGPRAIDVWTECGQVKGLITNRFSNDLLRMNFSSGPTGPLVTTSYGNIAGFSFPHSVTRFRSTDTLYAFITNNNNNTMSRVYFPGCTNASIPSTTVTNPPSLSYNSPGNYYISLVINEGQITQTNYCKQITVIPSPTVSVSNNSTICSGSTITLTASGANSYTWNPGAVNGNSISVTPTLTTTYTVIGTVGSCANTANTNINVINNPTVNIISSSSLCIGETATLQANGANSYTWNNGSNSSSIIVNPSSNSIYSVIAANAFGCQTIKNFTLNVISPPNILIVGDSALCVGNSGILIATGATSYTWNTGTISNSITINPNASVQYSVIGQDIQSGCKNNASITVTVATYPTISIPIYTVCLGQTQVIIASGALNYTWSTGGTGNSINVNPIINQTYTVTGSNEIISCTTTQTTLVNVISSPTVFLTANKSTICAGQAVILTASGTSYYQWYNGETKSEIEVTPNSTTTYTVTGSNNDPTCKATKTIEVIVYNLPKIYVTADTNACIGDKITLTAFGAGDYLWQNGIMGQTINVQVNANDSYSLVGVNVNTGCYSTFTYFPKLSDDCCEVFIPNSFTPNQDSKNDFFTPKSLCDFKEYNFVVYDRWGEKIFNSSTIDEPWNGFYKGKLCPQGVYIYKLDYTIIKFSNSAQKHYFKTGHINLIGSN